MHKKLQTYHALADLAHESHLTRTLQYAMAARLNQLPATCSCASLETDSLLTTELPAGT